MQLSAMLGTFHPWWVWLDEFDPDDQFNSWSWNRPILIHIFICYVHGCILLRFITNGLTMT